MRRALSILLVLSTSASAFAAAVVPPDKAACLGAHEQAQSLRKENKLRAAHDKLLVCAADACPALVKVDCAKWLPEVERDQPTLIVRASDNTGADVADVKVTLDGAVIATFVDGKPIAVDPGAHTIELSRPGSPPIKQQLVIVAGEKNRVVDVVFEIPDTPPETPKPRSAEPLPWILTGVGAAGIVGFAVLGITTRARISELRGSCAPTCDPSEEGSLRARLILADVSLGIGLLSLGAATYLFLRPTNTTSVALTPTPSGAFASFQATF